MNFDLTLAALYGVVTVVLFLYGAAQRHLRASVLRTIDLERAKAENSVVRAQENAEAATLQQETLALQRMSKIQEDIASLSKRSENISRDKDAAYAALSNLYAEIATAEAKKKELMEVLQTKDGQAVLKQAEERLRQADEILAKTRQENLARTSDHLVSVVSFGKSGSCTTTYEVAAQEMQAYWAKFPGVPLKLLTRNKGSNNWDLEWHGTNEKSFAAYSAGFSTYTWHNDGIAEVRVA